MKRFILVRAVLLSMFAASCLAVQQEGFSSWKKKYNKVYSAKAGKNESAAEAAFNQNAATVAAHNASNPKATYQLGLNANSDMTAADTPASTFVNGSETSAKSGKVQGASPNPVITTADTQSSGSKPVLKRAWPTTLDYSSDFPPAKNKGACSTGGMPISVIDIINYWSKKNGSTNLYSEQNLLDCVSPNMGCSGGSMYALFNYAITNGVALSSSYKYIGAVQSCQAARNPPVYFLQNSCIFDPVGDETIFQQLLVRYGPIATFLNTRPTSFSLYKSGVFNDPTCSNSLTPATAREAVVVVGYGTDPTGGDYWLVRPAFGPTFGMNGYARIARNKNNLCGIANIVEVPCVY